MLAAIAATGAGLHVAALYIEHDAHIGSVATVLALAVPVAVYLGGICLSYIGLFADVDPSHRLLSTLTVLVLVSAPLMAAEGEGVSTALCLMVVMLATAVSVVGTETRGHRHVAEAQERALAE